MAHSEIHFTATHNGFNTLVSLFKIAAVKHSWMFYIHLTMAVLTWNTKFAVTIYLVRCSLSLKPDECIRANFLFHFLFFKSSFLWLFEYSRLPEHLTGFLILAGVKSLQCLHYLNTFFVCSIINVRFLSLWVLTGMPNCLMHFSYNKFCVSNNTKHLVD